MPPRKKREPRQDGVVVPITPEILTEDDRPYTAYVLKHQGNTWREVAEIVGYNDEADARLSVQAYMQRIAMTRSREQREEVLQMQMDRLDDLYKIAYAQAREGDLNGVDKCLRVVSQTAKLWQLEDSKEKVTHNTVVVTEAEFAETLKAHVLGRGA